MFVRVGLFSSQLLLPTKIWLRLSLLPLMLFAAAVSALLLVGRTLVLKLYIPWVLYKTLKHFAGTNTCQI